MQRYTKISHFQILRNTRGFLSKTSLHFPTKRSSPMMMVMIIAGEIPSLGAIVVIAIIIHLLCHHRTIKQLSSNKCHQINSSSNLHNNLHLLNSQRHPLDYNHPPCHKPNNPISFSHPLILKKLP